MWRQTAGSPETWAAPPLIPFKRRYAMSRSKSNRIHRGARRSPAAQVITYVVPCGSTPFDELEEGPDPLSVGGADEELARDAHKWWIDAAQKANVDLSGFNPEAPLAERIAWAIE